jgi:hypothetical protein
VAEPSIVADETYYHVASSRLDEQIQRGNALDAKVSTVFGFSAALLPLFGALLAVSKADRPKSATTLYLIAIAVYCVLLVFVYLAYQVAKSSLRPDLETLKDNCEKYPEETMRAWVGNECLLSIAANEPRLRAKTFRVAWALRLLALDALLLALAAFFSIR